MERLAMRRQDYRLGAEQLALRDSVRAYFDKTVGTSRVRAAEPEGFDLDLWDELQERAFVPMALPESAGGDGAGLVELALLVEEVGRHAVPAPIVEVLTAARGLARIDPVPALLSRMCDRGAIVTVAPGQDDRRLVPSGAIAEAALAQRGDDLVLISGQSGPAEGNLACMPLRWWTMAGATVIGTAGDWWDIERDWHVLTAAMLIGLAQASLDLGVRYAKERSAFGAQIGSFQAVSHPLVDAFNDIESARRLLWRAAWFCDNEPESIGPLALCALIAAADAAETAGATAIHTQGGFGFTLESDVHIYYRRAKGWAAVAGNRRSLLRRIARVATQSREVCAS
jgi:alkylation response protein AidB-like acyl-CoA dehydrogenase